MVASLAAYFVFGIAIGYLNPHFWVVAAVLAWVAVFDALYNLGYALTDPTYPRGAVSTALFVLVSPLLAALTGSFAGRVFAMRGRIVRS